MRRSLGLALALLVVRAASAADAPAPPPNEEPGPPLATAPEAPALSVEAARQKVREAEAKVAAKDYEAAGDLYGDAYRTLRSDRTFLADYARCSFLGKRYRRAVSLLTEALDGADAGFLASPKGQQASELLPRAKAALEQEKAERLRAVASLVDAAIRGLPRHTEILKIEGMRTKGNEFTPAPKYDDLPLTALAGTFKDGKHVWAYLIETYEDASVAEGRRDAILATIRAQKRAWEKAFVLRTKDDKPELREVGDERLVEDRGRTERYPRTTFCWNAGSAASAKRTAVAIVEVHPPSPDPSGEGKGTTHWQVTTQLDSTSLK